MADGNERRPGADVVVVAAGSSARMAGVDKLAASIAGRPLLAWTLAAVAASSRVDRLILVTAPDRLRSVRSASWLPARVHAVVPGGASRQASVAAGVRALNELDPVGRDRPVLVHDGARPLVSAALVDAVIDAVERYGAALPVLPVAETLKRVGDGEVLETVDRSALASPRRRRGRGAASSSTRSIASRPTDPASSPTRPRCSRPVESPSMRSPANPRTSR